MVPRFHRRGPSPAQKGPAVAVLCAVGSGEEKVILVEDQRRKEQDGNPVLSISQLKR